MLTGGDDENLLVLIGQLGGCWAVVQGRITVTACSMLSNCCCWVVAGWLPVDCQLLGGCWLALVEYLCGTCCTVVAWRMICGILSLDY